MASSSAWYSKACHTSGANLGKIDSSNGSDRPPKFVGVYMRLYSSHPSAKSVVTFSDHRRYRTLFEEAKRSLNQLGVVAIFVSEAGQVEAIGL